MAAIRHERPAGGAPASGPELRSHSGDVLSELAPGRDWASALRERGLRVTRQRLAVLGALAELPHATVEALHARAREAVPAITSQAVYLMLDDLTVAGLVRRLDTPRQPARFEIAVGDNHHHLVCTSCQRIVDIDCVVGVAPCLEPAAVLGVEIDVAHVLYHGRCADCVGMTRAGASETLPKTPIHHAT